MLQGLNNRQHFLVVDLIVPFHRREGFREECDGMPLSVIWIFLRQDSSSSKIQAVCFNAIRSGVIWKCQNQSQGYSIPSDIEGQLLLGGPFKYGVCFSQIKKKGSSNVRKSFYKSPVEIDKPQERLDFLFV